MAGRTEGITSPRYSKWRSAVLDRQPLCVLCLASGRTVAAEELDHIVPRSEGGAVMDEDNVRPLCRPCHIAITRVWKQRKGCMLDGTPRWRTRMRAPDRRK